MSKYGSPSAFFLLDGYNMLLWKLKSLNVKRTSITEQTDGLGDNYQAFTPVGKQKFMVTQGGGFYDTSTNSSHTSMAAKLATTPQSTVRTGVIGCMGQVAGGVFWGLRGLFSVAYEVLAENSKLTKANAEHEFAGMVDQGMIVQPLAAQTADWNTKSLSTQIDYTLDPSQFNVPITSNSAANPSVVTTPVPHGLTTNDIILIAGVSTSSPTINGSRTVTVTSTTTFTVAVNVATPGTGGSFVRANSSNGAVGYQQVTAFSGFTGYVGKLRDSPDDVTYADLIAFANVTSGPAAEAATVAGVVDRYCSHDGDVTGSGSVTVFSGLARL